jgi:hypothetical protein
VKNTEKFIQHIVHNIFPLNEYSEGEINRLMTQFKQEADDLNIEISDAQLKKYIERFDQLKNSPKITEKDLRKYSLSKLIKLVTSSPGSEASEEEIETPDMVYNENGITIWNGAKQGNCITYGSNQPMQGGSRWCITQPGGSYWGRYRYGSEYKYPTFYLAKNNALPDSDKLSFVALQVLDNGEYKFTNRANNPGMEGPFNWEQLLSKVPWLRNIPNLKNILKYIPLSGTEKATQIYRNNPIKINQWLKEPFENKKTYLLVRAGNTLFSDISNDAFISKYLPKQPQIASIVASTAGIINIELLLQYLDIFSKSEQSSIVKQIRNQFDQDILTSDLSFDLKKYLIKTNKISLTSDERAYVTKDGKAIVLLKVGDDFKVGVYTEEDNYPNIKLNTRTAKFLLDYPDLDKIPFNTMLKLAKDEIIPKETINTIIEKAREDPNSAIVIRDIEGGKILIDSNSLTSYKIEGNKITKIPFNSEEVQSALSQEADNTGFQESILNILSQPGNIPNSIDKESFMNIIDSTPYPNRVSNGNIILTSNDDGEVSVVAIPTTSVTDQSLRTSKSWGRGTDWRERNTYSGYIPPSVMPSFIAYLRATGQAYNTDQLVNTIKNSREWNRSGNTVKAFISNNPPITADNRYTPVEYEGQYLLLNRNSPRESLAISSNTGKLVKAAVPASLAARILRNIQPVEPAAPVVEPAVEPAAQEPAAQQAAPAAQGGQGVMNLITQAGLATGFNALPTGVRNRILNGAVTPVALDRGATRRNGALGARGRVTGVITAGQSKFYTIRLASGTMIGSVAMQPGARFYVVTANTAFEIPSAGDLINVLQQRNLAEEMKAPIVHMHALTRPQELEEIKYLLQTLKK